MSKRKKATERPALHAVKGKDEPKVSPPVVTGAPEPAPDPEVPASAKRRVFTAEFKRRVLAEADACGPGELGALLRRYGLYSSHLSTWRRQRDAGELVGLTPRKRGRKAGPKNPLAAEVARLERELRRMTARAERAEGLVEVQKKLAALLGEELPPEDELLEEEPKPPRKKR